MMRPTVLFILGKGRSGSTLLDNVLGSVPGVITAGELIHLWDRGLSRGWRCGCGERLPSCPLWSDVLVRAAARDRGFPSPAEGLRLHRSVVRYHRLPRLLSRSRGDIAGWPDLERWSSAMSAVYRGLADATGARVIVDASKIPAYPAALGFVGGIDVRILHLVRDPRAVTYSWKRRKVMVDMDSKHEMPRRSALYSGTTWTVHNAVTELARRRLPAEHSRLLRYEDLVGAPRSTVEGLLDWLGVTGADVPFVSAREVRLAPSHTVGGNPDRMTRKEVVFSEDVEWRDKLSRPDGLITTVGAAPLLRRYGYSLRPFG